MSGENTSGRAFIPNASAGGESQAGFCVGRIAGVSESQAILVEWGHSGPKEARLIAGVSRSELSNVRNRGREVLLAFDGTDRDRPIIVGLLAEPLDGLIDLEMTGRRDGRSECAVLDGKRLTLEAEEEIVLRCGEGSITLRKDGKILIRGTQLLSRATGSNKIQGGSVHIN